MHEEVVKHRSSITSSSSDESLPHRSALKHHAEETDHVDIADVNGNTPGSTSPLQEKETELDDEPGSDPEDLLNTDLALKKKRKRRKKKKNSKVIGNPGDLDDTADDETTSDKETVIQIEDATLVPIMMPPENYPLKELTRGLSVSNDSDIW